MNKKVLFVYRTQRQPVLNAWLKDEGPDSLLFGQNHMKKLDIKADFFDTAYSPLNLFHPLFYPLEHAIINKIGMGFKIDQAAYLSSKFNNYDVIVGTGDSAGLPLLFLKHLKIINKPIIFMTAGLAGALKGKENTWVGKFYKKILTQADVFTSYSQVEVDFFEKKMDLKGKVKYMPLATDFSFFSRKAKTERNIICAVGTEEGRDYKTLFEAVKYLSIEVEVACNPNNIKGLKIPSNVKVHLNMPINEVLRLYQRALISVVPCKERFRSSGQMVVLESASAALPIVASGILGIKSAFTFSDKKDILFSKPHNAKDLQGKILSLIKQPKIAYKLGQSASKKAGKLYTTEKMAKRLARFIRNL